MAVEAGLLDRLAQRVEDYRLTLRLGEKGRVASVGDGIAWVYGLPSAAVDEILHFEDGSRGLVFDLQKERYQAHYLGEKTADEDEAAGLIDVFWTHPEDLSDQDLARLTQLLRQLRERDRELGIG